MFSLKLSESKCSAYISSSKGSQFNTVVRGVQFTFVLDKFIFSEFSLNFS